VSQPNHRGGRRPRFQPDYRVPETLEQTLSWEHVAQRLASAQNYWVVTVGSDGTPQATPVWAVWMGDALYFSCGRESQKARNLARNPRVAVHLESGQDVVIVRGVARELGGKTSEGPLIAAFKEKYGSEMIPDSVEALNGLFYVVKPRTVLAWVNFPTDVTRWDFD
jgi:PPOX class probable F420-dependent enzyme